MALNVVVVIDLLPALIRKKAKKKSRRMGKQTNKEGKAGAVNTRVEKRKRKCTHN